MPRGVGYRPPPIRFYGPRQLRRQANRQVRDTIKAQQAPIVSAQKLADQRAEAARYALQGFGLASASILKDSAPMAGDAYRQSAQEQSQMAGALSGEVGQQMRDTIAQQQATIDRLAKGGQMTAPNVEGITNSLDYGGGLIPGMANERLAASQIATASQEPGYQAGRTLEAVQGSIRDQEQNDQQYTQQMLDLAATVPQLRSQIMQQLQANELAKRNAWLQSQAQASLIGARAAGVRQGKRRLDIEQQRADVYARQGQARLYLSAQNLKLRQAADRRAVRQALIQGHRIDSSASHAAGYLIDRNGDPILNGKGKRIPVQSSSGGGAGGSRTGPGSTSWKGAYKYATAHYVRPNIAGTNVPDKSWQATPYPRMVSYLVGSYGLTRGQAMKLLRGMGIKRTTKRG